MIGSEQPAVSVIVLNFNGLHLLKECLDSLIGQSFRDFEIIVVDNGSTDGSVSFLKETYGTAIRLIESAINTGFAAGNNMGFEQARGRFIALLNNDAVAERDWLEQLFGAALENSGCCGMWASKILFYDNRKVIDTAGHLIYPDGLNRGRGKGEVDNGQYDRKEEVFFPSGCAALYAGEMIREIGGFDPDFFAYGDDTDLGIRARISGWTCIYVPGAVVYHKSSATAGVYSALKAYLVERNRIWVLFKYFPVSNILMSVFYTITRYVLQAYGALTNTGAAGKFVQGASRSELIRVLFRAYRDAFSQLPAVLRKRREMSKLRKISKRDFSLWLRTYKISAREISLKD